LCPYLVGGVLQPIQGTKDTGKGEHMGLPLRVGEAESSFLEADVALPADDEVIVHHHHGAVVLHAALRLLE